MIESSHELASSNIDEKKYEQRTTADVHIPKAGDEIDAASRKQRENLHHVLDQGMSSLQKALRRLTFNCSSYRLDGAFTSREERSIAEAPGKRMAYLEILKLIHSEIVREEGRESKVGFPFRTLQPLILSRSSPQYLRGHLHTHRHTHTV